MGVEKRKIRVRFYKLYYYLLMTRNACIRIIGQLLTVVVCDNNTLISQSQCNNEYEYVRKKCKKTIHNLRVFSYY